jgi:hypothetical protein
MDFGTLHGAPRHFPTSQNDYRAAEISRSAAPGIFVRVRRKSGPIFRPDLLVARHVSPAAQYAAAARYRLAIPLAAQHAALAPARRPAAAGPPPLSHSPRHLAPHVTAMHHTRVFRLLAAVFALSAPVLAHADTSATLATAINIPKGPASIEGFGRAYEVSPASGLPSLSYPLEVPPGRAGHAPSSRCTTTPAAARACSASAGRWTSRRSSVRPAPASRARAFPRSGSCATWATARS